eukprot:8926145-Pyramimonas_sp.AAC.1
MPRGFASISEVGSAQMKSPSRSALGTLLGPLGAVFGLCWASLASPLGGPGGLLERSGGPLGPSW